jgi:hypothetical protein
MQGGMCGWYIGLLLLIPVLQDLSQAVESFKEKASAYQARLEEAEIARAKSSRAEALGLLSLCYECSPVLTLT